MSAEVVIGEHTYRLGKLSAFQQFHVARKLAPLIAKIGPAFAGETGTLAELTMKLEPLMEALASMPEDDCNYVLIMCLGVTQRQQGPVWANVWNVPAKRMQFEDIDLRTLLEITARALQDNLSGFFKGLQASTEETQATTEGESNLLVSHPGRTGF